MPKFVFALILVLSPLLVVSAQAASTTEGAGQLESLVGDTELGKNLQTLQSYYQEVNRQLDKRLQRQPRDPFAATGYVTPPQAASQPRFTPRPVDSVGDLPAVESGMSSRQLTAGGLGLPPMNFRGFLKTAHGRAALLDVKGIGALIVREGDKIGLQQLSSDTVLRIVEINALNLIVEVGSLGEKLVVQ